MRIVLIFSFLILNISGAKAQSLDLNMELPKIEPEQRVIFNPLVSSSARTLPNFRFGFQKATGANINTHVLSNSLNMGLFDRFEIGATPVFYLVPGSRNYMGKFNFYRGDRLDLSASYSENRFKSSVVTYSSNKKATNVELVLRSINLGMNARPVDMPNITISPLLTIICGHIESTDKSLYTGSIECEQEFGLDVQYQLKDRQWLTVAWAQLRESGFSPYEKMSTGSGLAWSMLRPKKMFSRPSLGAYYTPSTNNTLFLVSTTFFEK